MTQRGPTFILAIASSLHPEASDARSRQALEYMSRPLVHAEDALRRCLIARGFAVAQLRPLPPTSIGQLKHRLAVLVAPR
jgi:hypothetical protein